MVNEGEKIRLISYIKSYDNSNVRLNDYSKKYYLSDNLHSFKLSLYNLSCFSYVPYVHGKLLHAKSSFYDYFTIKVDSDYRIRVCYIQKTLEATYRFRINENGLFLFDWVSFVVYDNGVENRKYFDFEKTIFGENFIKLPVQRFNV